MSAKAMTNEHDLQIPERKSKFQLKPKSGNHVGLFYVEGKELDRQRGCIGHVRIDFGHGGHEFWHTWWPRGPEELNSPEFKKELTEVVNELRENVLRSLQDMRRFCYEHGGEIRGGWSQNYGYEIDTDRYRYCLRCNPVEGDYQAYLTCYDKNAKQLVGRLSYASGEVVEYKDEQAYIDAVKEELPYRPTTGLKIETLTTDPAVRKAVDDCIYDLFGEENPRLLEDYKMPNQKMEIGGI